MVVQRVKRYLDAGFRDQDIGGLEIAMGDSLAVRGFERAGQLDRILQRLIERQRTFDLRTFDVFHDQVVGADVVESANVRMV